MIDATLKKRRWWTTFFMGLLVPGVGQVHVGELKKGILLCLLQVVPGGIGYALLGTFEGLLLGLCLMLGYHVLVASEAALKAWRMSGILPEQQPRSWYYPAFIVANILLSMSVSMGQSRYEAFVVPSSSMIPALEPGDHFMGERIQPDAPLQRGEIVVFLRPDGVNFVKRIAALPGDEVVVRNGLVSVNGQVVNRGVSLGNPPDRSLTVDAGNVFVLGDNSGQSWDSRFFGPVGRHKVHFKALYLYWAAKHNRIGEKLVQGQ